MKKTLTLIALVLVLAACSGKDGATGPMGPKGDKGDTGNTGEIGPQGPPGTAARTVYFTANTIVGEEANFAVSEIIIGSETPAVMCYISIDGISDWLALPTTLNFKGGESTFSIDDGVLTFYYCGGFYGMIVIVE